MNGTVGIVGAKDRQIEEFVRTAGMRPVALQIEDLASPRGALTASPDVVIVDVRTDRQLLLQIAAIKRRHPSLGVAILGEPFTFRMALAATFVLGGVAIVRSSDQTLRPLTSRTRKSTIATTRST